MSDCRRLQKTTEILSKSVGLARAIPIRYLVSASTQRPSRVISLMIIEITMLYGRGLSTKKWIQCSAFCDVTRCTKDVEKTLKRTEHLSGLSRRADLRQTHPLHYIAFSNHIIYIFLKWCNNRTVHFNLF